MTKQPICTIPKRSWRKSRLFPVLARNSAAWLMGLCFLLGTTLAAAASDWNAAATLQAARENHTATLLPNGKVLVAGGGGNAGFPAGAELYDTATNAWTAAGVLAAGRYQHTATLLPNGKVMVAGGFGNGIFHASAELYDPATNAWSNANPLAAARTGHSAILLPNGKVLVAGGYGNGLYLASAEMYEPATNTWTSAGTLASQRAGHTVTLLSSGKVMVAGGRNSGYLVSSEVYDPATNSWSVAGSLATARSEHTATLLSNGKILVAGGLNSDNYLAGVELFDPATDSWTAAGALATARYSHTATLLPNGKVLVAGGWNSVAGLLTSAELYDPVSNSWTSAGALVAERQWHTATLLQNGTVLVAAGSGYAGTLASTELYSAPSAAFTIDTVTAPMTGLWWNQNESGWGLSVEQQGPIMFIGWYTYDQSGASTRYFMSNCAVSGNGCSGSIYSISGGAAPTEPWTGRGPVTTVGTGTLTFSDLNTGVFSFELNGVLGTKTIQRNVFGTAVTPPAVDYTALWWNPNESGWGVFLAHQSPNIFAVLFTYDAAGNPMRYVASNCAVSGSGCTGTLYKTSGGSAPTVPWVGPVTLTPVGTVTFAFTDAGNGTMNLTIDGRPGTKTISRMVFYTAPG